MFSLPARIIIVFVVQQYPNVQVPFSTVFPGSTIPDWFLHNGMGQEVNIDIAPDWYDSSFLGFALSAVIAPEDYSISNGWTTYCHLDLLDLSSETESSWVCSFTDAHTRQLEYTSILTDHLWLAYVPSVFSFTDKKWSHFKFSFSTSGESCIVNRWGVCPLYTSNDNGDYSNGKCYSNESLGVKTSNEKGNPSGSVLDDLREWGLEDTEDTVIRSSFGEDQPRGRAHDNVNGSVSPSTIMRSFDEVNSQAWKQDRIQKQPHPPTSNTGTHFVVFITIFIFLFLARISH